MSNCSLHRVAVCSFAMPPTPTPGPASPGLRKDVRAGGHRCMAKAALPPDDALQAGPRDSARRLAFGSRSSMCVSRLH